MEEIQRLTVQRRLGGMLQYRLFDNEDWGANHGRFFRRRSWTQRTMRIGTRKHTQGLANVLVLVAIHARFAA